MDIVKGCLGFVGYSREEYREWREEERGQAQLRVFNLGNSSPVPVTDLVEELLLDDTLVC
ncbi:hypothetical protein NC652_004970 [Populus alba x Populus x berolinensis]|nr:hypothetical protein NC652_004970 [Populus alba x Populus x berolinensis]